jgi:hypothetical protein
MFFRVSGWKPNEGLSFAARHFSYQFAFKRVPKEAEKLGELCPPDPRYVQVRAWHPNHRLMLQVRARTLTSFGFALTLRPDVKRFKFSVRCFVRTPFVSAHPLAALHVRTMILLYMALRRAPSKCLAAAAGAERLVARADARGQILPCPDHAQGCGEVTSPLFSITSILNANWYEAVKEKIGKAPLSSRFVTCGSVYGTAEGINDSTVKYGHLNLETRFSPYFSRGLLCLLLSAMNLHAMDGWLTFRKHPPCGA